jgi:hypothetical protein
VQEATLVQTGDCRVERCYHEIHILQTESAMLGNDVAERSSGECLVDQDRFGMVEPFVGTGGGCVSRLSRGLRDSGSPGSPVTGRAGMDHLRYAAIGPLLAPDIVDVQVAAPLKMFGYKVAGARHSPKGMTGAVCSDVSSSDVVMPLSPAVPSTTGRFDQRPAFLAGGDDTAALRDRFARSAPGGCPVRLPGREPA